MTPISSSMSMELDSEHILPEHHVEWFGYKFVGDNLDQNTRASHQRPGLPNQSMHNFHGYALRDRINFSELSDAPPSVSTPDVDLFLPSALDVSALKEELSVLIAR